MVAHKKILEVYSYVGEDGKAKIDWKFGENLNCYFLIGLLEDIKKGLLDDIDDQQTNYFKE